MVPLAPIAAGPSSYGRFSACARDSAQSSAGGGAGGGGGEGGKGAGGGGGGGGGKKDDQSSGAQLRRKLADKRKELKAPSVQRAVKMSIEGRGAL